MRIGACYDTIKDLMLRNWGIELPVDPGLAALQMGHLKTPPKLERLEVLVQQRKVTA